MGDIVGKVSGLFGVGGAESVTPLQYRPYDVNSAFGQSRVDGRTINAQLSPELQSIFSGLLQQAPQQFQQAQSPEASYNFLRQSMGPQLEQQRLSQESRLFNQGLLGSTAGGLQTQALRQAQEQALLQNALGAQQQAFQRGQGLLGQALQIGAAPLGLSQLGAGVAEGDLKAQEGTEALRQGAEDRQASFFSSLVSAGSKAAFSDVRLKKNIKKVGKYTYTWEWSEKAKDIGADVYPTSGVIAQEVMEITPQAVFRGDHGYLMVDYSKVA